MEDSFRIFGLGTIVVDHQVMLERLPEADSKGEIIDERYQIGGPVPTALCLLRRFGCEATFLGRWAKDKFGDMIEKDLNAEGIAYTPFECQDGCKTGFAHVWVEQATGRRSIAAYRGSHQIEECQVHSAQLTGHSALHLDGWSTSAAIKAAELLRASGGTVFLDLGSPKPHLPKLLAHVNSLNCPLSLLHRLYETDDPERGAKQLIKLGPRQVTVTDGAAGAWLFRPNHPGIHQPAFRIDAKDTNGAGDTFAGAMIYATMQSWPPDRRLRFASAAAALKCTRIGNRDALPSLSEISQLLESC